MSISDVHINENHEEDKVSKVKAVKKKKKLPSILKLDKARLNNVKFNKYIKSVYPKILMLVSEPDDAKRLSKYKALIIDIKEKASKLKGWDPLQVEEFVEHLFPLSDIEALSKQVKIFARKSYSNFRKYRPIKTHEDFDVYDQPQDSSDLANEYKTLTVSVDAKEKIDEIYRKANEKDIYDQAQELLSLEEMNKFLYSELKEKSDSEHKKSLKPKSRFRPRIV